MLAVALLVWAGFRLFRPAGNGAMRIISRLPLEARRSLYLVEAAGSYLLIGAGEGGLSTLATLDAEQVKSALAASAKGEKPLIVRLMELVKKEPQS